MQRTTVVALVLAAALPAAAPVAARPLGQAEIQMCRQQALGAASERSALSPGVGQGGPAVPPPMQPAPPQVMPPSPTPLPPRPLDVQRIAVTPGNPSRVDDVAATFQDAYERCVLRMRLLAP